MGLQPGRVEGQCIYLEPVHCPGTALVLVLFWRWKLGSNMASASSRGRVRFCAGLGNLDDGQLVPWTQ